MNGEGPTDLTNPQSLNLYAYVLNNPLRFFDPFGLDQCQQQSDGSWVTAGGAPCTADTGGTIPGGSVNVPGTGPDGFGAGAGGAGGGAGSGPPELIAGRHNDGGGGIVQIPLVPLIKPKSFATCVKDVGDYFSLQNGLKTLTNGKLGTGPISGALLGNSVSDVIGLFQGNTSGFLQGKGIDKAVPAVIHGTAAVIPDIAVSSTRVSVTVAQTTTSTAIVQTIEKATTTLPLGTLAKAGAGVLTDAMEGFSALVKAPIDLTTSSFSAIVCSIGR